MSRRLSTFILIALLALSTLAMLAVSSDAHARRFGGGMSFGRQSTNILKQRKAVKPPAAQRAPQTASGTTAAGRTGAAGTQAARSGMSRWLAPLAGIAAGLGIAALLSALGLSGAFLEFMSSLILIALVIWAASALIRRLRAAGPRPATQGARPMERQSHAAPGWQKPARPQAPASMGLADHAPAAAPTPADPSWFIPEGFDTPAFLENAKTQFAQIQALWDHGDLDALGNYLTDDLLAELSPQILAQTGETPTEIVLLNAQLMGIEQVAGGHLASVRYSGMLRESPNPEATRFEEVWNLYKADGAGWLVAGIQQLPAGDPA